MGAGRIVGALLAALLACGAGAAHAAGPGETFMVGALPLDPGALAGGSSGTGGVSFSAADLSADGRYAVFTSAIDGLAADDDDDTTQVYRKDRSTGEVVLVSRATGAGGAPANGNSTNPLISDAGTRVAFVTDAALDAADGDIVADVYLRDLAAGTTRLLTPGTPDPVYSFDLSADGLWVAFATTAQLSGFDANGHSDIYRRQISDGATTLVSRINGPAVTAANGASHSPSLSANGRYVAYASEATNIVAAFGDNSAFGPDVYLRDMDEAGLTHTLLVSSRFDSASQSGNGESLEPRVAVSGATVHVVFTTYATNLVDAAATDTSSAASVLRRQMIPGPAAPPVLVSRADGVAGANADSRAHTPSVSGNGRFVVFSSDADNLAPANDYYNVYVRDLVANTTRRVSVNSGYEIQGVISADGSVVSWIGTQDIHPDLDGVFSGVFARTHAAGVALGGVELLSRPPGSAPLRQAVFAASSSPDGVRTVSADGRYVLLNGIAPALPGSTIELSQVYRRDTLTGEIILVSRAPGAAGAPASQPVENATMSADGNRVAFTTRAPNLDPAANGSALHAFVRDIAAGTTRLVSRGDGPAGAPASGGVAFEGLVISADGSTVLFPSDSVNLGAPGGIDHLYARRLATNTTLVVDRADGLAGAVGTHSISSGFGVSGDGTRAVFASQSSNFGFPLGPVRVYLRDLTAGTTRMISRGNGEAGAPPTESSIHPTISSDGRVAAFVTTDDALAPEAGAWPGGTQQLVVRDLVTHQNRLASRGAGAGAPGNDSAGWPSLSADGAVVAWESNATNLLPGRGGDGRQAIFARTLATGVLHGPPAFGRIGNYPQNNAHGPSISENGSCLAFSAGGHTSSGFGSDISTAYIHVIAGECTSRLGPEPVVPGPTPPPPAAPLARPSLTRVSLLNPVFRVGTRVQVLTRAQRRRGVIPTGTRFRFRLSTDAALRIVLQQRLAGRRVGKACRPVTRVNRARRACVRFVPRMTITRASLRAGTRSIAFTGRQGRKRLAPGRYRAVHRAVNAGGASVPVIRAFRVVPRR